MPGPASVLDDPRVLENARHAYERGESMASICQRLGCCTTTLKKQLIASGSALRSRKSVAVLHFESNGRTDLYEISGERWRELYWGPDRPSLISLARQFGCSDNFIKSRLELHGIAIRTNGEQQKANFERGKQKAWAKGTGQPPAFIRQMSETQKADHYRKVHSRLDRSYLRTKGVRSRIADALRKPETRRCSWCGIPITRPPHRFSGKTQFCETSHASRFRSFRRQHGEGAPRPLLLEALAKALGDKPRTPENVEKWAERIGAGEPEILELLIGHL